MHVSIERCAINIMYSEYLENQMRADDIHLDGFLISRKCSFGSKIIQLITFIVKPSNMQIFEGREMEWERLTERDIY